MRVDSGVVDGSVVSIFYDPMLAKVISYAPTRRQAAAILADALARTRLHGITTNRDLLVNVLRHPAFLDGATDTAFFDTHGLAELAAPLADPSACRLAALAAALADAAENRSSATVFGDVPSGWRNLPSGYQTKRYADAAVTSTTVAYRFIRGRLDLPDADDVTLVSATPDRVVLATATASSTRSTWPATATEVFVDGPLGPVRLDRAAPLPRPGFARSHKARCWPRCRGR